MGAQPGFLFFCFAAVGWASAVAGADSDPRASPAAALYTVHSNADDADAHVGDGLCDTGRLPGNPECTLRAALQEALAGTGGRIAFDLAPQDAPGPRTIAITQPLPVINRPIALVGSDQVTARAILSGEALAAGTHGLVFAEGAQGSELQRLTLQQFGGNAVHTAVAIRLTDVQSIDNRGHGVYASAEPVLLSGTGNVFSRNAKSGIHTVGGIDASDAVLQADDNGDWGVRAFGSVTINGGGSHDPNMVPYLRQVSSVSGNGSGGLYVTPADAAGHHSVGASYLQADRNGSGSLTEEGGHGLAARNVATVVLSFSTASSNRGSGVYQLSGDVRVGGTGNEFNRNGHSGILTVGDVDAQDGELRALWNGELGVSAHGALTLNGGTACHNSTDNLRAGSTITLHQFTPCAEQALPREDMECLLDAMSIQFASELPASGAITHSVQDYLFRHYPSINAYLGVRASDQALCYAGPLSQHVLVSLGPAAQFAAAAGCSYQCTYERMLINGLPQPITTNNYALTDILHNGNITRIDFPSQSLYRRQCVARLPRNPRGLQALSDTRVYLSSGQAIYWDRAATYDRVESSGVGHQWVIRGLWDAQGKPAGYNKESNRLFHSNAVWEASMDPIDSYANSEAFGAYARHSIAIEAHGSSERRRWPDASSRNQSCHVPEPRLEDLFWAEEWDAGGTNYRTYTQATCTPNTSIPLARPPDADKRRWVDWR